jgi:hypothetical protein
MKSIDPSYLKKIKGVYAKRGINSRKKEMDKLNIKEDLSMPEGEEPKVFRSLIQKDPDAELKKAKKELETEEEVMIEEAFKKPKGKGYNDKVMEILKRRSNRT